MLRQADPRQNNTSPRQVIQIAWPVMVSMLSYTAMSLVDTLYVGRLGTDALAAVGLAIPVMMLLVFFGQGVLRAVKVTVAQATGAEDHTTARSTAWQGVWAATGLTLAVYLLVPLLPVLMTWMGAGLAVTDLAVAYGLIRMLGVPGRYGYQALSGWFQGRGDTRTPMVAMVLANVINILLDPILIFGWGPVPALGVVGAALATNVGEFVGTSFLVFRMLPQVRGVSRRPDRAVLERIRVLGVPLGIQGVTDVLAFTVFAAILARIGEAHMAAHVIVIRIIMVSFLPGHALSEAAGVLVGQAVGANRPDQAREALRWSLVLGVGFMAIMGGVFWLVPGPFIDAFGVSDDVRVIAMDLMLLAACFQVFDAVAMIGYGALSGAGDTRFVMRASLAVSWGVKVPLVWLFAGPLARGAQGAWTALTLEIIVLAALVWWRTQGTAWLDRCGEAQDLAIEARS